MYLLRMGPVMRLDTDDNETMLADAKLAEQESFELQAAIALLAEMSTSSETPGVAADEDMDRLITAARIVERRDHQRQLQHLSQKCS